MDLSAYLLNYLDEIYINENIKKKIMDKLFESLDPYHNFEDIINESLSKLNTEYLLPCNKIKAKKWIDCKDNCFDTLLKFIKIEVNSTAYMLRVLSRSIISLEGKHISFLVTDESEELKISGIWENDEKFFKLDKSGYKFGEKHRLIMGFGPSGSGKTFTAKFFIELFSSFDKTFPKSFMIIDGGIYRDSSIFYRYIVETTKKIGFGGLNNLVLPYLEITNGLFDASSIKKLVVIFMKNNKNLSLYVPETLVNCGFSDQDISCDNKIKEFKEITGDKSWIGLLVWQHKYGSFIDCEFDDEYKCIGCTFSGRKREIHEGKKYSNKLWKHSFEQGMNLLMSAPGGKYKIHNSGGQIIDGINCKSIIEDYSEVKISSELLVNNDDGLSFIKNHPDIVYIPTDECVGSFLVRSKSLVGGMKKIKEKNKYNYYKNKYKFLKMLKK